MKRFALLLLFACSCHRNETPETALSVIQIQDRNGVTETISHPERLASYEEVDFLTSQPYQKVVRTYRTKEGNFSKLSSYHPNGHIARYLEAQALRASGVYREWFENGQLRVEANVIGGTADLAEGAQGDWIFDGVNTVWDEQGQLLARIAYVKGSLEGPSIYFFPSGQIRNQMFFSQNNLEGEAVEYFESGAVKSRIQFKKGLKEGDGLTFAETGQMLAKEHYKADLLITGIYKDITGATISEVEKGGGLQATLNEGELTLIEFRRGKPEGLVRQFTADKHLKREFSLKSGKKQGEEIEFFLPQEVEGSAKQPQPKLSIHWHDQAVHGTVKTWYPNGQLQSEREYARNLRAGPALAWYPNGSVMFVEEYEDDLLMKGQYYRMNRREPTTSVAKGNGVATLYDETGIFIRKVTYQKGKPVEL